MSHRPRTRLRCQHNYQDYRTSTGEIAESTQCVKCGHRDVPLCERCGQGTGKPACKDFAPLCISCGIQARDRKRGKIA